MPEGDLFTAIIAAGAALLGSLLATFSALRAAGNQHRRTLEAERRREKDARELVAMQRCGQLLSSFAEVVARKIAPGDEVGFVERGQERVRLNDELTVQSLLLPSDVRGRVDLGHLIIGEATYIVDEVNFYVSVSKITLHVADHVNEVLAAKIKDEPLPKQTEMISHLSTALDYLDEQRHEEHAGDRQGDYDAMHQWLVSHPPYPRATPPPRGPIAFVRRLPRRALTRALRSSWLSGR